ncbi:MAG TPA: hypothetical protein VEB66_12615 [Opitutaceae bacterium]|nr:hypothetical protein [Opitutaceae bacterium]
MNQETVTYLTNIVIGGILTALATHYWWQHRATVTIRLWVLAAWILTIADVLFAARPLLPHPLGRLLPTLGVTLGHAVMLIAAQETAARRRQLGLAAALVGLHAAALVGFLAVEQPSHWRMVVNGLIWGGFSVASAWCLRQGGRHFWRSLAAPATVFLIHGAFHGLRVGLAILLPAQGWDRTAAALQIVGDLEVSFFMVALYVGLLIAYLQVWNEELTTARAEVRTLSGLLPMCAWCKKVRDDEGYWEQVEEYFSRRSQIRFTHGVCVDCLKAERKRAGLT